MPFKQLRDRKTAEGTFDELMARSDLKDDYLRLKVTDRVAGSDMQAELGKRFPYLLEVTGISADEGEGESTLTAEELKSASDEDILKRFLAEKCGNYIPTEEQLEMFREAMAMTEESK